MIHYKLEAGVDYNSVGPAEPEMQSLTKESSCYRIQDSGDRGETEPKKKPKKLWSIKLSRLPSLRSSTRRAKSRHDPLPIVLYANPSSTPPPIPIEISDAPPCYMKATRSSDARRGSLQKSTITPTRRSILKPGKSLARMSSLKIKRTLMSKSYGGTEVQGKVKRSRSIKQANFEWSSTHARKLESQYQASLRNSESSFLSKKLSGSRPKYALSGNKSVRFTITRTSSLKPVKVLTKMGTFKLKKPSMEKCYEICQSPDSSIHKATCSSILKDSKFPDSLELELQPGECESEGKLVMRVCRYTYCSLHGHNHNAAPPLKRFVSMRRRLLKTQKSMKGKNQLHKGKRFGKMKKGIQSSKMLHNGDPAVGNASNIALSPVKQKAGQDLLANSHAEEPKGSANGVGSSSREDEDLGDFEYEAEWLPSETLYNHPSEAADKDRKQEKSAVYNHKVGEANSILIEDSYNGDSTSFGKNLRVNFPNGETPVKIRRPSDDEFVESTGSNSMVSSDFDLEPLEDQITGDKDKKGNLKPHHGLFQRYPTHRDSEPIMTNHVEHKTQFKNQKYIRMWHLIYKHAVVGVDRKAGNQVPLNGLDEEQVEDTSTLLGTNDCGSSEGFSEIGKDMVKENHDANHQKNELSQINAIQLVQKAFDDILLQEFQDHSMEDQSIASSISSDHDLLEKSHGEGQEWSISAYSEPARDSMVQEPEETWVKADSISTPMEERTASNVKSESDQKMPKSWSYLKKLIILKKFVKALEKVGDFSPRGPRYLPLKPDPEAEKVHLRHQTTDERKNTEEWMLDNALQQVISKLAPAQKRKVALLVEAFETVLPLSEIEISQSSNAAIRTRANTVQACNGPSTQSTGRAGQESNYKESAEIFQGYPDQVSDFLADKQLPAMKFSELTETTLECCSIKAEQHITACQDTGEDWKEKQTVAINIDMVGSKLLLAEGQPDSIISCSSEIKDPSSCNKFSLKPENIVSTCHEEVGDNGKASKVITPSSELSNSASETEGEDLETNPGFSPCEEYKPEGTIDVANEARSEKGKNMRLWYLVYKHMVSGIAAKDGAKPYLNEAGKEEPVNDANSLPEMGISSLSQNFSEMNQDMDGDNEADKQNVDLHRTEAIKLVEEAIDEILLPEIQDHLTNDEFSTSEMIQDKGLSEEKVSEGGKPFLSNCKNGFMESHRTAPGEKWLTSGNISTQEKEKTELNVGKKSNKEMPSSWSTLKKWILLKRFIKALEKVREFNPKGPCYLPLEPDPEGEKVHLRHQEMDQRKNSEEWMLDYALQQVVAKLTPARKRKVELLVQAFETVIPTIGC
ncbi:hypothetical protein I3760_10G036400 [Carya illinoinensis]|nr:hypothetical protein I3760_10G036400 [Carya illinoinensis]